MIRNTELEEAIEKGSQEKALELGLDIKTISKITGLSMEEIEKLK